MDADFVGPKYPDVFVQLTGEDGNAGAIMGRVAGALRRSGVDAAEVTNFRVECISGDYNDLLRTVMRWVETA